MLYLNDASLTAHLYQAMGINLHMELNAISNDVYLYMHNPLNPARARPKVSHRSNDF
jgi:hypothetical protein